jgi:predicted ribosomally synthesized peptide with nif11-like leader
LESRAVRKEDRQVSMDPVKAFFEKAAHDAGLQAEMVKVLENGAEYGCCTFSALAARHGFEFTPEELHDAIEELRTSLDGQELTDDDLDAVAGGIAPLPFRVPLYLPLPPGLPPIQAPQMRYGVPGRSSDSGPVNARYAVPRSG